MLGMCYECTLFDSDQFKVNTGDVSIYLGSDRKSRQAHDEVSAVNIIYIDGETNSCRAIAFNTEYV